MPRRPFDSDPPPGEEWRFTSDVPKSNAKVRVAALAARQLGRVGWRQLRASGIGEATIADWRDDGYLHKLLPGVYAVGHPARSVESDLAAALLYAGPGAMLSHGTAIWWLGLLKHPPRGKIVISTPRRVSSHQNMVIHGRRNLERIWHKGLPTTTVSQALLDYAATGPPDLLRLALAAADYEHALDPEELLSLTGRGIKGSEALKHALEIHLPQLAHARSHNEIRLLKLCESHGLPIPTCNIYIEGWLVDAIWPDQRLIVEVDGPNAHRTPAQIERDHQRDLELRRAGYTVLRYTGRQLEETPQLIAAELTHFLVQSQP